MSLKSLFPLISIVLLASCGGVTPTTSSEPSTSVIPSSSETTSSCEALRVEDLALNVYGDNNEISILNALEGESFEYTFAGDSIRIEEDKVIAVRGASETEVTVNSSFGRTGKFSVSVASRRYRSTHENAETNEGWFNDVNIQKVENMTSSFANGIDISSLKQLYDNGQRFYNKDGVENSLLYILKDAGVNWVRLRVWNEPFDTYEEDGETKTFQYGGGNCTNENMAWIAHEAKEAGLKILLNFHYSDFWCDPSNQIVPKAWANIANSDEMALAIKNFTKESLLYFESRDALPDAVAIGNEITSGLLIHNPGSGVTTVPTGSEPLYSSERTDRWNGTEARFKNTGNKADNVNLRKYLKAGVDAVNEVNPSILKMVHFVKGFSDPNTTINFVKVIDDLGFDILGLSAYPSLHYINKQTLSNGLNTISDALPSGMQVAIAEISYGFTYETDANAANSFHAGAVRGEQGPVSSYAVSIQGQANCVRDASEVVANLSNGFGVFYWEGAWTPTKQSGWADAASMVTWANQAFFSYNGKALGSLEVYNKMLGK